MGDWWEDDDAAPQKWTGNGPQGYGTYYLDGPGGTPGSYIGNPQAPSTGGGGTPSINISNPGSVPAAITTIYDSSGRAYSYNELTGESKPIMLPDGSQLTKAGSGGPSGNPYPGQSARDFTGNPDYSTRVLFIGGRWQVDGKPTTMEGALLPDSGGRDTVETDPMTGRRYRATDGVWQAWMDPAPSSSSGGGSSGGSGGGGGGSSSSTSTRAGGFTNTNVDVREGGYTNTNIDDWGPGRLGAEQAALAQAAARDAAQNAIQRAQLRLELGKGLQGAISATDPAAWAAFQLATGGGTWGGLKGGLSALSRQALQPGAEMLAALDELGGGGGPVGASPAPAIVPAPGATGLSTAPATPPAPATPAVPTGPGGRPLTPAELAERTGESFKGPVWNPYVEPAAYPDWTPPYKPARMINTVNGVPVYQDTGKPVMDTSKTLVINPSPRGAWGPPIVSTRPSGSPGVTSSWPLPTPAGKPGSSYENPNYPMGPGRIDVNTGRWVPGAAHGGMTTAPMFLGNERGREMFFNPTGAPIGVMPNRATERMMRRGGLSARGMPGYADGTSWWDLNAPRTIPQEYTNETNAGGGTVWSPPPSTPAPPPLPPNSYLPWDPSKPRPIPQNEGGGTVWSPPSPGALPYGEDSIARQVTQPEPTGGTQPSTAPATTGGLSAPQPATQPTTAPAQPAWTAPELTAPPRTGLWGNPPTVGQPGYVAPPAGPGTMQVPLPAPTGTLPFTGAPASGPGNIGGGQPYQSYDPASGGWVLNNPPMTDSGTSSLPAAPTGGGLSAPAATSRYVAPGFGSPDVLPPAPAMAGLNPYEQRIYDTRTGVWLPPISYLQSNYFNLDPVLRDYYQKGLQDIYGIPAESTQFQAERFRPVGLSSRPRLGWVA